MTEVEVIIEEFVKYPEKMSTLCSGQYGVTEYNGKEVIFIKTFDDGYQMLNSDDGWGKGCSKTCRILPKGTKILITI